MMTSLGHEPPGTVLLFPRSHNGAYQDIVLRPKPTDSPNDPLTWSKWRKAWHTFVLILVTGLGAGLSTCSGAASYATTNQLGISPNAFNVAVAILFVGIGGGTYLMSPIPRLLGRRLPYIISLVSGIAGSIMFAKVQRTGLLIASQLFMGVAESCSEAMVQHSLSDIFFEHQRGSIMGLYVLAISGGTFLSPLISGFIAANPSLGWRWTGWLGLICTTAALVLVIFTLEETTFDRDHYLALVGEISGVQLESDPLDEKQVEINLNNVEQQMQLPQREQVCTPRQSYRQRFSIIKTAATSSKYGLFRDYLFMLRHTPRCFIFPAVLFSGLQWGAQMSFLTFYLTVEDINYYGPPWNYGDAGVAVMNVPCLIGLSIGIIYGGVFGDYFVAWKAKRNGGVVEAEYRLWLIIPASFIGSAGLLLFGIGTDRGWHWPLIYFGLGCIGFTWGCSGDISLAYMQQAYPEAILECMVGVAVINNIFGCAFTFGAGSFLRIPMHRSTTVVYAC